MEKESVDQKFKKITTLLSKMGEVKEANLSLVKQFSNPETNEIPKKSFLGINVGDIIPLNELNDSYGVCIYSHQSNLKFVVVAEKYSVVSIHSHNFKERIKLMEGKLRELVTNQMLLPGQEIVLEPSKEHGFISEDFSIYSIKMYLTE